MIVATCHPWKRHHAKGLCMACYGNRYYQTPKGKAWHEQYYVKNRSKINKKRLGRNRKDEHLKYKEKRNKCNRDWSHDLKQEWANAYGGKCSCCGESILEFLTVEHTNHNGKEDRAARGFGPKLLATLRKEGWPKEGYDIFCMNCNWATRNKKVCPHRRISLDILTGEK